MAKIGALNTFSTSVTGLDTPLNENFDTVETAFNNTISRDGSTPNFMEADFDLNGNDLLNGGQVYASQIFINGVRVTTTSLFADERITYYPQTVALAAADVNAGVDLILVGGYASEGDGGHALYKREASNPTHSVKIQDAGGTWWSVLPIEGKINVKQAGAVGDGTTDDSTAIQNAIDYCGIAGGLTLIYPGNNTFLVNSTLNADGTGHAYNNITHEIQRGCTVKAGQSFPDMSNLFYAEGSSNIHITGEGTLSGRFAEDGKAELLTITTGITDGDLTGTAAANYTTSDSQITINNLGTGHVLRGTRVEDNAGNVYIVQSTVAVVAGTATNVTLDRTLDAGITSGDNIFLKQYANRSHLNAAVSAGATSITVLCADVSTNGNGGVPRLVPGDQFAFHDAFNDIDTIDYTEIYTVVTGADFSGSVGAKTATVTITPAIATDKVVGQMITSFQDHRNNEHSLVLFIGTTDCSVSGVTVDGSRLHGVAFNATINAPSNGLRMETNKNTNWRVDDVKGTGMDDGVIVVSAWADDYRVTGCSGRDMASVHGFSGERNNRGVVSHNNFADLQHGIQITGEVSDTVISDNICKNCNLGVDIRTVTRRSVITNNVITSDSGSAYGIRLIAGYNPETAQEDAAATQAIVSSNLISGPAAVTGSNAGSGIIVQPQSGTVGVADNLRPYFIYIGHNTIYDCGRDGIRVLDGVHVDIDHNHIYQTGYAGIWIDNGAQVDIRNNTVADIGKASASPGIHIQDLNRGLVDGNRVVQIVADADQTYGINLAGTNTDLRFGHNLFNGNTARINGTSGGDNVSFGLDALTVNGASSSVAIGREALRGATGSGNTSIGTDSGRNVSTGASNVIIGNSAGASLTTGNRNTLLGANTNCGAAIVDSIAIGRGATTSANGEFALGSSGNPISTDTTASAGASGAVPAQVLGYLEVTLNGTAVKIPYFDV